MGAFDNTSLRFTIFYLKEFMLIYLIKGFLISFSKIYQTINVRIKIICLM